MTVDFPVISSSTMLPTLFTPPLQNPSPGGLYPAVTWAEVGVDEPSRHLTGVEIRGSGNFPGEQVGVWGAPWCGVPAINTMPKKDGERGDLLDPFDPIVIWGFDSCDATAPSRREVEQRAAQALRMRESVVVARTFADRLLLDADDLPGALPTAGDAVAALAHIEGVFAAANVVGLVHLSPTWLPVLVSAHLVTRPGLNWVTPAGHALVLDGGYVAGLGATWVGTSAPLWGWRDAVALRTALDERTNTYMAVAERSVLVAYEAVVAAVEIT